MCLCVRLYAFDGENCVCLCDCCCGRVSAQRAHLLVLAATTFGSLALGLPSASSLLTRTGNFVAISRCNAPLTVSSINLDRMNQWTEMKNLFGNLSSEAIACIQADGYMVLIRCIFDHSSGSEGSSSIRRLSS